MATTCQICARETKLVGGLIAHHGYRRPGCGWQTASCFGARRLPYEHPQGFDAILDGIRQQRSYVEHTRATATKHEAGEGKVLVLKAYNHSGSTKWMTLEDYYSRLYPGVNVAVRVASALKDHEASYRTRYAAFLRQQADLAESAIPHMQARYDNHPTIKEQSR